MVKHRDANAGAVVEIKRIVILNPRTMYGKSRTCLRLAFHRVICFWMLNLRYNICKEDEVNERIACLYMNSGVEIRVRQKDRAGGYVERRFKWIKMKLPATLVSKGTGESLWNLNDDDKEGRGN